MSFFCCCKSVNEKLINRMWINTYEYLSLQISNNWFWGLCRWLRICSIDSKFDIHTKYLNFQRLTHCVFAKNIIYLINKYNVLWEYIPKLSNKSKQVINFSGQNSSFVAVRSDALMFRVFFFNMIPTFVLCVSDIILISTI